MGETNKPQPNFKPAGSNATIDAVEAYKQKLRIKLWQMIANNNDEALVDPLAKPLENSMPYVHSAQDPTPMSDDVKEIKPTLDEVLPLPKKNEKPSQKKKAKDLLKSSEESDNDDENQITVFDAISEVEGKQSDNVKQSESKEPEPVQSEGKEPKQDSGENKKNTAQAQPTIEIESSKKKTIAEVLEGYFKERKSRNDRNDYFKALKLQKLNKNEVCKEILKFLDEE